MDYLTKSYHICIGLKMKIKTDFVTNSSSTSFLIITQDELKEEHFMKLMGVEKDSELYDMVEELYYRIKNEMIDARKAYEDKNFRASYTSLKEYISGEFYEEVYEKIITAEKNKQKVYVGTLNSDEEPFISFLCMDCFVEETDKIYFNYTNCYW